MVYWKVSLWNKIKYSNILVALLGINTLNEKHKIFKVPCQDSAWVCMWGFVDPRLVGPLTNTLKGICAFSLSDTPSTDHLAQLM